MWGCVHGVEVDAPSRERLRKKRGNDDFWRLINPTQRQDYGFVEHVLCCLTVCVYSMATFAG